MIFIDEYKNKNFSGIYKITQVSTGKIYIGQTKMRFIKRYWHHRWKLKNNIHDNNYLQNAWNKYGELDFKFEIIHIKKESDNLNTLEIMYIKKYNTLSSGFNLTSGGEGKRCCPMSETAKKIVGEKNRLHNLGKKHSDETKKRMSESSTHRKITPEHKETLIRIRTGSKHSDESKEKMRKSHIGSKNAVSVINEKIAHEIKIRLMKGESQASISKDMDIDRSIIRAIIRNITWVHVHIEGWDEYLNQYNKNKKIPLKDSQVLKIRKLLEEGKSSKWISDYLGIGYSVIAGIKQNRTYKNVI